MATADVKYEFDNLRQDISQEETEDNWEKISKAMQAFIRVAENHGYESAPMEVVNAVRTFQRPITNAMNSERTRLCVTALDLVSSVASGIGRGFESIMPLFMPTLLALCGRTNRVVMNRARTTILGILESTQLACILPFFVQNVKDKSATLRLVLAEGTLACLNSCNPPDLEKEARAKDIEAIIRGTARDANPDVRKVSRKIFESYKILLPSRVDNFTAPLSPTMKKYLDIKSTTTAPITNLKSSKSITNLRDNCRPEPNPTVSSIKPRGHMRSASASNANVPTATQSKNLAAKLTQVARNEQASSGHPAPAAVQPVKASRAVSESQRSNPSRPASATSTAPGGVAAPGPGRTVSNSSSAESKSVAAPYRTTSRSMTTTTSTTAAVSTAPRRLQVAAEPKTKTVAAQATNVGPRRVPMAPPPPPAPKKSEREGPKRGVSTSDNSASTKEAGKRSSAAPPAPTKKAATVGARERAPNTKPPIPKFRPTSNAPNTAGTTSDSGPAPATVGAGITKPLMISKSKPTWGRSAPPAKFAPSAAGGTQKTSVKAVMKKPSSLLPKVATGKSKAGESSCKRPVTPAMVALPPSPTPESRHEDLASKEDVKKIAGPEVESVLPELVLMPKIEVNTADGEDADADADVDKTTTHYDPQVLTTVSVSPTDSRLSTPTHEEPGALVHVDHDNHSGSPTVPSEFQLPCLKEDTAGNPHTPQTSHPFQKSSTTNAAPLSAKTPISALLSSIERGFLYSPTTPLSPADAYLPGPNGTIEYRHETHAPRVEGPMRPFNYALHVGNPGGVIFSGIGDVREEGYDGEMYEVQGKSSREG